MRKLKIPDVVNELHYVLNDQSQSEHRIPAKGGPQRKSAGINPCHAAYSVRSG